MLNNLKLVYFITFLTSFNSISYEILVARLVSHFTHNYVLSQALTISFFILSLGVGSYAYKYIRDKSFLSLFKIEVSIMFFMVTSILSIFLFHILIAQSNLGSLKNIFLLLIPQLWVFLVGFLAGMEIPFLLHAMKNEEVDKKFSYVLAVSYFGSFLGSSLTVSVLIAQFGILKTAVVISLLTLFCCALLVSRMYVNKIRYFAYCASFLILNLLYLKNADSIMQFYLKNYYYGWPANLDFSNYFKLPDVKRTSTPYQDIDVVKDQYNSSHYSSYYLFIDYKLQYTSSSEVVYHESMVHGAFNLNKYESKKILVLGGGDGLLVREILKYNIDSIDVVELDQKMIDIAQNEPIFTKLNAQALSHSKVKIHVADAFIWMKNNQAQYDAIFVDFPHPYSVELSRLYSFEFYSFLNKATAENGFIVFDFPYSNLIYGNLSFYPNGDFNIISNALIKSGFSNIFIYGPKESFVFAKPILTDLAFDEELLFDKVQLMTLSNLVKLQSIQKNLSHSQVNHSEFNSIFKPYFLIK